MLGGLVTEFTGNYLKAGMGNKRKFVHHTKWTAEEANRAKRDLKEDEFLELCLDASAWIGRRIQHEIAT